MTFLLALVLTALVARPMGSSLPEADAQEVDVPAAAVPDDKTQPQAGDDQLAAALQPNLVPRDELITVGEMAPDFMVSSISGKQVRLSDLRGSVVVLSFWFLPCDACVYDLQYTQEFSDWIDEEEAPVVSLVMDEYSSWIRKGDSDEPPTDQQATTRRYLARKNITMDVMVDPEGTPVQKAYGVKAYPTRVVVDPDGRVSAVSRGNRGKRLPAILKAESLAAWHTWQARQLQK